MAIKKKAKRMPGWIIGLRESRVIPIMHVTFYASIKNRTALFATVIDTFPRGCTVINYIPYSRYDRGEHEDDVTNELLAVNGYLNSIIPSFKFAVEKKGAGEGGTRN